MKNMAPSHKKNLHTSLVGIIYLHIYTWQKYNFYPKILDKNMRTEIEIGLSIPI